MKAPKKRRCLEQAAVANSLIQKELVIASWQSLKRIFVQQRNVHVEHSRQAAWQRPPRGPRRQNGLHRLLAQEGQS